MSLLLRRVKFPRIRNYVWIVVGVLASTFFQLAGLQMAGAAPPESPQEFSPAALEFFEKEVRPLLASACYECHSRQSKTLRGGLMLDARADVLKGGDTGPAVVPGKAKESLLVDAINFGDTYQMPPKKRLQPEQIAVLTKWVDMGAPWPKEIAKDDPKKFDLSARRTSHWCWQPIQAHSPPAVKNQSWARQPLDQFVLAKLEEKGIGPAQAADKSTLIRRAYFDLIGLPPSWSDVEAFVADKSPKAFEKVVDRLLDSPHFGERWARHWMDSVRFAETYGHEFDYAIPHAAQFRDYLIRAYNSDVPYDQFVKEQIAGDLLKKPRLHPTEGYNESIVGTGFWWFGEATHAPVDVANDECNRIENQIDVMTKTFLGATVACARCHDHKFDAITTKDFYALSGFLKSSRRQEAPLDPQGKIAATMATTREVKATIDRLLPAALGTATVTESASRETAKLLVAAYEVVVSDAKDLDVVALRNDVTTEKLLPWVALLRDPELKSPSHPLHVWFAALKEQKSPNAQFFDRLRSRFVSDDVAALESQKASQRFADFEGPNFGGWMTTGEAFGTKPTGSPEWDAASQTTLALRPGVANSGTFGGKPQGTLRSPTFTISHKNIHYRMAGDNVLIRLVIDGYFMTPFNGLLFNGTNLKVEKKPEFVWVTQGGDIGRYLGHRAYIEVLDQGDGFAAIDEVWFSDSGAPKERTNPLTLAILDEGGIDSIEKLADSTARVFGNVALRWEDGKADRFDVELMNLRWKSRTFGATPTISPLEQKTAAASKQLDELTAKLPAPRYVLAMTDGSGQNDQVHVRGSYRKLSDVAPRRLMEALDGPVVSAHEPGSGRMALAEQIVDPKNPLTARVMVNRVWHHLFGRGIFATVDNVGVLGQRPTHPELLDYLAIQFQQGQWGASSTGESPRPWSTKRLIRSLALSSTYQMSSLPTKPGDDVDPANLLFHRATVRRMEGEIIRDAILKISGRLDPATGGSSVPVHLTTFMQGRGRPRGGPLDGNGRRSLYTEVRRNFLPPMMLAFDSPIPFSAIGARNVSNVPAQALIMMNDPFVIQQAEVWARRLLAAKTQSAEQRISTIYHEAYGRSPTREEIVDAMAFLEQQSKELNVSLDKLMESEKPWADLCHVLMNVKEFIFVN